MNTYKTLTIPQRPERRFLPNDYVVSDWQSLQPIFDALLNRAINSKAELERWLADRSELESMLEEEMGWRYIRMTCDTANEAHTEAFHYFVNEIEPQVAPYSNAFDKKILESSFLEELQVQAYSILIRNLKKDVELFREENIPLLTQIQTEQQQYGAIAGAMTVEIDGQEMTLQQASVLLQSTDRAKREAVYMQVQARRLQDHASLDTLYSSLIGLRHQVARNTGEANFRDYMFKALGRFDYTAADCFNFHAAVAAELVPLLNQLAAERKQALGVASLRPWDLDVDAEGRAPLMAFGSGEDLLQKTIACFNRLDPFLGECLQIMQAMGHLDLESRKGKAPGGYNYPLDEIGVPFIFMNATSTVRDMVTLLHEGGHAVHSILTKDLPLQFFKHTTAEAAELASMAMELITMDHWDLFFENPDELRRAKLDHLEQIIETLPWVATIDAFQHWVYENPGHTEAERLAAWNEIFDRFSSDVVDWSGLQYIKDFIWQKQLHLFEVPFYYIEYAIAQLGAIAVWKNYKQNPKKGLAAYKNALKLGYTVPLAQIYAAAEIKFDFSQAYIRELIQFVKQEMENIKRA